MICNALMVLYSMLFRFWPVEELAKLADGSTGCGEVARGGCYLVGTSLGQGPLYLRRNDGPRPNMALVASVTRSQPFS